ncbi:hypothetical protein ACTXT7_001846 [Hymenolepis weldensis]
MSSLKPDADGFFEVAGRKRNIRSKTTIQSVRFNAQRPRVMPSAITTTSNATTSTNTNARSSAIEKAFDRLLEKIPHLYTIMNTIDTTKAKKIDEHRKDLDKALAVLKSVKEDKYFFITCSMTSLSLFLQDLSDLVEESCIDKHNPYRNINSGNSSESSEEDDAKSDSDSSKTIVAEEDEEQSNNQGENGEDEGVEGMKNLSLKEELINSAVSESENQQASSSTKSSEMGQDETSELNQGVTKRRKRNRRKKNKVVQQEEEINTSIATESENQQASSSTKSSEMENEDQSGSISVQSPYITQKKSPEPNQNTSDQHKRKCRKENKSAQQQGKLGTTISAENKDQDELLTTQSPEVSQEEPSEQSQGTLHQSKRRSRRKNKGAQKS